GEAVRLGDGVMSRFSPDGQWVVGITSGPTDPGQITLLPVGAGERRRLTSPPTTHEWPSFVGPSTLLFVKQEADRREGWRVETDGSGSRRLALGCDLPAASPLGRQFACIDAADRRRLYVYPMGGGEGRKVFQGSQGGGFKCVRWSQTGDRLLAVATD